MPRRVDASAIRLRPAGGVVREVLRRRTWRPETACLLCSTTLIRVEEGLHRKRHRYLGQAEPLSWPCRAVSSICPPPTPRRLSSSPWQKNNVGAVAGRRPRMPRSGWTPTSLLVSSRKLFWPSRATSRRSWKEARVCERTSRMRGVRSSTDRNLRMMVAKPNRKRVEAGTRRDAVYERFVAGRRRLGARWRRPTMLTRLCDRGAGRGPRRRQLSLEEWSDDPANSGRHPEVDDSLHRGPAGALGARGTEPGSPGKMAARNWGRPSRLRRRSRSSEALRSTCPRAG